VTLDKSGKLAVKLKAGKEYVALTYRGMFGERNRTTGHPFKDDSTELIEARREKAREGEA
jgi:hypothetical protein